jgi:two-component system, LytTR family, response regulator
MSQKKTRCLIVDDEPIGIRVIRSYLERIPDMEIVGACQDPIEAFELIGRTDVDLIFLDINMPELSGIDLIRSLESPPRVIFTTAHREYALEGFDLDVVDYLLKPVSLPRMLKAIDKYRRIVEPAHAPDEEGASSGPEYLTVRSNRQNVKILVREIRFIESLSDYTKFHTSGKPIVTKRRISHLEEELSAFGFIRIHRSFLVPVARIRSYSGDSVTVGDAVLPISRSYKTSVLKRLEGEGQGGR